MESDVPMAAFQGAENQPAEVVSYCLRVPLVLRAILQHFSNSELLKLSLVNKLWSYEAATLLRNRASLTVTLNPNRRCQDLRQFASDLKSMKENRKALPISGITVSLGYSDRWHGARCTESSTEELTEAYDDILNQITWKHLSVKFCWRWPDESQNCPGFLLVTKILAKFGSTLEEFSLEFRKDRENFLQQYLMRCCNNNGLPNLKILNIHHHHLEGSQDDGYINLIKALVSLAPNLKVLQTPGLVDLSANLLEGSSSAMHVIDFPFSPLLNEISESVMGRLRVTTLGLTEISPDLNLNRFNKIITCGLLKASRYTLSRIHTDVIFLVPLMTVRNVRLENVKTLEINFSYRRLEFFQPRAFKLIKSFDFNRVFPKLTEVKVASFSDCDYRTSGISGMVEHGISLFREPLPDRAANIKTLDVDSSRISISDSEAGFLAEMFPDIETLSIVGARIPFSGIWESWSDLKALQVKILPPQGNRQCILCLDSSFCGIFPKEVAELRQQSDDYLERVNIVPVMPSITNLKGLKTLCLDSMYLFSKVTCLIAFQRCPALDVTVMEVL